MPVKSVKQLKFMRAIASGGKIRKGMGGLSKEKAKEFISNTSKKKRSMFSKG